MGRSISSQRGSGTAEHAGLVLLVALLCAAGIAALASRPPDSGARDVATAIARKMRCAPRLPGPCWQDPLTAAYGRSLGGLVRAFAPEPATVAGLLPVDYRLCRQASCALPGASAALTASNRRVTTFVTVRDHRQRDGTLAIEYWNYRPGLEWERITRTATSADVATHASTPLLETDHPRLVALETLAGANHFRFSGIEEPPWRWRVERR